MNRIALAALVALASMLSLSACNPSLSARSVAPPGRTARLDAIHGFWTIKGYKLELSQGVAIALTCEHGGPCQDVRLRSDDPSIAMGHDAALGELEPVEFGSVRSVPSGLVVVGKAPGTTRIRVDTEDGHRDVFVTVVAQPASHPMTAATP